MDDSFTENDEVVLNALFILISFTENVEVDLNALFIIISSVCSCVPLAVQHERVHVCTHPLRYLLGSLQHR